MTKIKKKTHSGAKKRFKLLKSGLVKAAHQGRRHILTKKTSKRKRALRQGFYVNPCESKRIASVL